MSTGDFVGAAIGLIWILVGVVGKDFYYSRSVFGGGPSGKKAPVWFGRLVFILVGAAFLLFSVRSLFL
jgi:hypothetical protein